MESNPQEQLMSITMVTWCGPMKPGELQGVRVNTDDIDAEHQRFTARGLQLTGIDPQPWGR